MGKSGQVDFQETAPVVPDGDRNAPARPRETFQINRINMGFPVYAVAYCSKSNILLVAGGGGPAKSGVRNVVV